MKHSKQKIVVSISSFIVTFITNSLMVLAGSPVGNPWDALNSGGSISSLNSDVKNISISLYKVFQRIGLYGCIITTVGFLAYMALRWGDPRIQSETKSKIVYKFAVAFAICGASFFLGLVLQIIKSTAGYD